MKFLPLRDFDTVTSALNFLTSDCRVSGGCDLYTTKAAGTDKKLYKSIDRSLESRHEALLKFGASLSPPQREQMAASLNLSRSSPFGSMSEISSRRTFAYLIATLNASHPDYDFSHVLRPADFRREKSLQSAMATFDNTMSNARPRGSSYLAPNLGSSFRSYSTSPAAVAANASLPMSSPVWGPQMWAMVDKEMKLKDCTCFSYQPSDDPFDGEEAAIWRVHYFFFNKALKRVAYLYVRGVPVVVNSPALQPHSARRGSNSLAKRQAEAQMMASSADGASKRAKYWLGDQYADRVVASEDDYDSDGADAVMWDPDEDIDFDPLTEMSKDDSDDDYLQSDESDEEADAGADEGESVARSPQRGMSEDIAARMELDV
ncbi:hypothetical protein PG999_013642 [Apiospora kogelbergensis]|uniref:Repressor of RNA polymerase III transcription MAF1 n=1 Tax=Apiospora kogelbergensis TaxID=1337665 RepID=A0AAW0QFZ5_9PEZI